MKKTIFCYEIEIRKLDKRLMLIKKVTTRLRKLHNVEVDRLELFRCLPDKYDENEWAAHPIFTELPKDKLNRYSFPEPSPVSRGVELKETEVANPNVKLYGYSISSDTFTGIGGNTEDPVFNNAELNKLYKFLLWTYVKWCWNKNYQMVGIMASMIFGALSNIYGAWSCVQSNKVKIAEPVKVQIEQTAPQNQSEPITPGISTIVVPTESL